MNAAQSLTVGQGWNLLRHCPGKVLYSQVPPRFSTRWRRNNILVVGHRARIVQIERNVVTDTGSERRRKGAPMAVAAPEVELAREEAPDLYRLTRQGALTVVTDIREGQMEA